MNINKNLFFSSRPFAAYFVSNISHRYSISWISIEAVFTVVNRARERQIEEANVWSCRLWKWAFFNINKILGREANTSSKCIISRKCCDICINNSSGGELDIDQGAFRRQEFNSGLSHQDANGGLQLGWQSTSLLHCLDGMASRTQHGPLLASLQHQVLLACSGWVNLVPIPWFYSGMKFQASQDGNAPFPLTYPHLLQLYLAYLNLLMCHLCLFLFLLSFLQLPIAWQFPSLLQLMI